jgi:hypothetical protein
MTPEERSVTEALQILARQADDCTTCLYAYLTIHAVAGNSRAIRERINNNAVFWNVTLHALQAAMILALGRVFETNTPHNVNTFMRAMVANDVAFRRPALRIRKRAIFGDDVNGLDTYMQGTRVPCPSDFRRVANFIRRHRNAYTAKYQALRNQVFAHTLTANAQEIGELFSKTNIRELQRMTTYLGSLHDAFWQAFHNGGRLTVRPRRYSIAKMLRRPKGRAVIAAIQETVVSQTKLALQPWAIPDRPRRRYRKRRA